MTDKYIRIVLDSGKAEAGAKSFDKSMVGAGRAADNLDKELSGVSKTTSSLTTKMRPLAAAISAALSIREVVQYADSWTKIQNQLRIVTSSHEELVDVTGKLFTVANETRSSFESTSELYSKMQRSTKALNLSQSDLVGVTTTINQLFAASGASATEADNAIRQLTQGFQSGTLRGDEFNSVAEQAPDILKAVAKYTGWAEDSLRDMAAEGKITSKILIESLSSYGKIAQSVFDKTSASFQQNTVIAKNNATAFVGASAEITGAVTLVGESLVVMSENLETVKDVFLVFTAVMGGRMVSTLTASAAAMIQNTAAMVSATAGTRAYVTGVGLVGTATGKTTVAMNLMTVSATAAGRALALVGGPIGVAVLAASALVYFYNQAETAKEKTARLASEIVDLTETYRLLDEQSRNSQLLDLNQKIAETTETLTQAKIKLQEQEEKLGRIQKENITVGYSSGNMMQAMAAPIAQNTAYVGQFKDKVNELTASLSSLETKKGALTGVIDSSSSTGNPTNKADEEPSRDFSVDRMKLETESMRAELELRHMIQSDYRTIMDDQEISAWERKSYFLESKISNDIRAIEVGYQKERDLIALKIEELRANGDIENQIKLEKINQFEMQRQILLEESELAVTEVASRGVHARIELEQQEARSKRAILLGAASDLLSGLAGNSKKAFNLQKKAALGEAAVSGGQAAIAAWRSGMSMPGPYAPLFAAAYTGASLLKTGAQIKQIKSQQYGGGGSSSSAGGSGGLPSIPTSSQVGSSFSGGSSLPSQSQTETKKIVDFRNFDSKASFSGDDVMQLLTDIDVAVVIDGTMQDAKRVGAI